MLLGNYRLETNSKQIISRRTKSKDNVKDNMSQTKAVHEGWNWAGGFLLGAFCRRVYVLELSGGVLFTVNDK